MLPGEAFRFLIGGGLNTAITIVVYWSLLALMPFTAAYALAFALGIVTGYTINSTWVFKVHWSWKRLVAFPLVHAANFCIGIAVLWVAVRMFDVPQTVAPLLAIALTLPFNFLMTRLLLTYRQRGA